jgi:phosphoribosylaminoimidazole-succinocarboxamide synthase
MLIYKGKTKDLHKEDERYYFVFKDDVTGKDGVFDPGENQVGGVMEGSGRSNIILSTFLFKLMEARGIPTHFISSDPENKTMEIKKANVFGKGLEVICRYRAVGSFLRRYGAYCKEGDKLNSYVEFTLKDDKRNDPLITKEGLEELGILKEGEYDTLKNLTRDITKLISDVLAEKGLELYDIKLEFGRLEGSDEIILIDEVSGGNMRAYKGEEYIEPLELAKYFE